MSKKNHSIQPNPYAWLQQNHGYCIPAHALITSASFLYKELPGPPAPDRKIRNLNPMRYEKIAPYLS
jgi:hypothetical protein